MKRLVLLASMIVLCLANITTKVDAQTAGTLTFSVTTTEPAGNYSNVNVIALWIADTNGNFVKTKIRYASSRIQYLNKWITASSYNVVDAVTGATRNGHGTLTFTWNSTNVSAAVVADGYYRVYIQMSDKNAAGNWTYVQFLKDGTAHSVTPANSGNFTNMALYWTPSSGIDEAAISKLKFACTPNPVSDVATINYSLETLSDVTISLLDLNGRNIAVLADGNQPAGDHQLQWDARSIPQLSKGIYFLRINTGSATAVKKIIVR